MGWIVLHWSYAKNNEIFVEIYKIQKFFLHIHIIAICRDDCHSTRGYCEVPNECRCRLGWAGPTCKDCQVRRMHFIYVTKMFRFNKFAAFLHISVLVVFSPVVIRFCRVVRMAVVLNHWNANVIQDGLASYAIFVSKFSFEWANNFFSLFSNNSFNISILAICAPDCNQKHGYCKKPGKFWRIYWSSVYIFLKWMHLFLLLHQSKVNADARLDIMEKIVENLIVILVAKMETAAGHGSAIASKFKIK